MEFGEENVCERKIVLDLDQQQNQIDNNSSGGQTQRVCLVFEEENICGMELLFSPTKSS